MTLAPLTNLEKLENYSDYIQFQSLNNLESTNRKILSNLSLDTFLKKLELTFERLYYVLRYVKKVEKIDIDEKGEPAFYVSYDDWINYVENSDLQAIVFPTKRDFEYLDAMERIGIKIKSVAENEDLIIVLINECEKLIKSEYIAFVYGVFNALSEKREILPTCVGYSDEEMLRHLEDSYNFSEKYLGKWYEWAYRYKS